MKEIKVYHLNQYVTGGAAKAARRLFDSLLDYEDLDLKFYAARKVEARGYFQYQEARKASLFRRSI